MLYEVITLGNPLAGYVPHLEANLTGSIRIQRRSNGRIITAHDGVKAGNLGAVRLSFHTDDRTLVPGDRLEGITPIHVRNIPWAGRYPVVVGPPLSYNFV